MLHTLNPYLVYALPGIPDVWIASAARIRMTGASKGLNGVLNVKFTFIPIMNLKLLSAQQQETDS
jgi:hypothetical protein